MSLWLQHFSPADQFITLFYGALCVCKDILFNYIVDIELNSTIIHAWTELISVRQIKPFSRLGTRDGTSAAPGVCFNQQTGQPKTQKRKQRGPPCTGLEKDAFAGWGWSKESGGPLWSSAGDKAIEQGEFRTTLCMSVNDLGRALSVYFGDCKYISAGRRICRYGIYE